MPLTPRFDVGDEAFFYEDDGRRTYGVFAGHVSDGSVFVDIPESSDEPASMASVDARCVYASDDSGTTET